MKPFLISICILLCWFNKISAQSSDLKYQQVINSGVDNKNQSIDVNNIDNQKSIFISFGEKLSRDLISISHINEYDWKITGDSIDLISGQGDNLFDIIFEKPGTYAIVFIHNEKNNNMQCQHEDDNRNFQLIVLDEKFEFLFDNSELSNPLIGGVELSGTVLTIPVIYSSYDKTLGKLIGLKVISAGINTTLIGEIKNPNSELKQGLNNISFDLYGKATSNTYIMFDIIKDNVLLQTYYFQTKVQ
jgi:hypothetical protein